MTSFLIELTCYRGPDAEPSPVSINPVTVYRIDPDRQVTKWKTNDVTGGKTGVPDHDGCAIAFLGVEDVLRVRESYKDVCELFEDKFPA